jgi:hypothetical protein
MNKTHCSVFALFFSAAAALFAGPPEIQPVPSPSLAEQNSHDIFDYETTYTFSKEFYDDRDRLGSTDSIYNDFSYAHRFQVTGNWYFRAGVEYERFDFNQSENGLPDHLQTIHALVAYEYVVHDHAGAGVELDPGAYFQNDITKDAIDVPWKVFVTFPLKKDKIFGVIGVGGAINQSPIVAPGGGLIWLFSDNFRLEGVFPKPALVYNLGKDWEFRLAGNLYYESYRTEDVFTPLKKLQVHDPVVQYSEIRAGGQVTYSGIKPLDITFDVGSTLRREFDFFRAEYNAKVGPAPYLRLAIEAKF